jgi:serine/threonine-protein kinase
VAIKRLRSEHRDDVSIRRMFLDEAKIAGLIRHPNVVSVLDVGTDERGPFLVMDFVEGVTASRMIRGVAKRGELLPVQLALRIVRQVALGLDAAHTLTGPGGEALGVIHRDISPQNILVGFDGAARLTDFGIAKALGQNQQKTTTGLLKGKVGYMSPEQLRFERPTQRSDLFSLGVVLFELLSAQRLYKGVDTVDVAQRILSEPVPDIYAVRDDVPPLLVELLFEILAKDPASRPANAKEIAQRLSTMIDECVAEEGTLPLDDFLTTRFTEEQTKIREKSSSMVRDWEAKTAATPRRAGPGRGVLFAIGSVSVVAIVISVLVLVSGTSGSEPRALDEPPETTLDSEPVAAVRTAAVVDDAADSGADVQAVEVEVEPEPAVEATPTPPTMRRRHVRMTRMNGETIRAVDHAVEF